MNEDYQIQQLVDGDLDHESRSALLRRLEEADEGWRRLALAFVEQQVWAEAIPLHPKPKTTLMNPVASRPSRPYSLMSALLAIAGMAIGLLVGANWQAPGDRSEAVAIHRSVASDSPAIAGNPDLSADAASYQTLADAIARSSTPLSLDFRRQLLQAGYVVSENEETTTVDLPVGGKVNIPVRKVEVQFLGLAAYQ